jgi:anaerobic nitric oxide reductase flavorubredoxin
MKANAVSDGIYRLSANGGSEILFESMWPLPHGVAMNSYIVRGRETALIDGVCGWDGVPETLFVQLEELGIELRDIRYVILNHLEPDHTGWLEPFLQLHDDFQLIASAKGLELVRSFYGFEKNLRAVADGDTLDLGDGKKLEFKEIPNVHWPETIATFETGSRTLFPCDLYGSFGSVEQGSDYDDRLDEGQLLFFEEEASRYYSNILATFSSSVGRAIDKLEALEPRIIAPAHGIVWRKNPERIVQLYRRLVGYARGKAEPAITLIWGSMYGMTERAVEAAVQGIREEEVPVSTFRVPQDHISHILASAWRSSGIVLAAPTYEYKMFPPMAAALDELGRPQEGVPLRLLRLVRGSPEGAGGNHRAPAHGLGFQRTPRVRRGSHGGRSGSAARTRSKLRSSNQEPGPRDRFGTGRSGWGAGGRFLTVPRFHTKISLWVFHRVSHQCNSGGPATGAPASSSAPPPWAR